MLNQLSDPYPDRDYMCIVDGCYTLEFLHGEADVDGLSFTISSSTDDVFVNLKEGDTFLDFCVEGTTFNANPTAAPSSSPLPTWGPTYVPSAVPVPDPTPVPSKPPSPSPSLARTRVPIFRSSPTSIQP